ncbi:hypothetical protein GP486_007734 [Trichoglossum hirsutum]|uniref:Uncharacterized protein n=1 Tax=Trichoglossum hirsutum TaxID=265104 RepID=A0A9P8L6P0_9PEZI|nr:hypothetical protein GP486_007734 [Trichoglossum hirsutum]
MEDIQDPGVRAMYQILDGPRSNFVGYNSLVMVHYAGRVAAHTTGEMALVSPITTNWVSFDTILSQFYSRCFRDTDVIIILDSCFFGDVSRRLELADRSIEIIASMDTDRRYAHRNSIFARNRTPSLTSMLADEVGRLVDRDDTYYISFAEVVGELRRVTNHRGGDLPAYHLLRGKVETRLPITGLPEYVKVETKTGSFIHHNPVVPPGARMVTPRHPPGELTAAFKLETTARLGDVRALVALVSDHPASDMGLEVTGIYRFQSKTTITFHVPWNVWAQLDGLPGFTLISEALRRNELVRLNRPGLFVR